MVAENAIQSLLIKLFLFRVGTTMANIRIVLLIGSCKALKLSISTTALIQKENFSKVKYNQEKSEILSPPSASIFLPLPPPTSFFFSFFIDIKIKTHLLVSFLSLTLSRTDTVMEAIFLSLHPWFPLTALLYFGSSLGEIFSQSYFF